MSTPRQSKMGRPRDAELAQRRREQILCAAAKVFAARGFRQTEVQEVADVCGISKGLIYRYFPSKEAMFLASVDRGMQLLQQQIDEAVEPIEDPIDRIRVAIETHLAFFDRFPGMIELFIQERAEFRDRRKPTYFEHRDANIGRWRQLTIDLIEQGRFRRVPVDRILDVVSDLLYGSMFTNYFRGRIKPVAEQAQDILDIVMHGILSDEERCRSARDGGASAH